VESVPVNQRWEGYYQFFPKDAEVLGMAPSELGPWLLRYMMKQHSMTNRFNFGQVIPGGQIPIGSWRFGHGSRYSMPRRPTSTAVVAHHHRQPTGYACLYCIYPHIPEEDARERDIADLLGLTLDQVKRRIVDGDTAAELSRNFGEPPETFLGKSMDSLAKARCSSAPVTTAARQAGAGTLRLRVQSGRMPDGG
jgi:hypothetical protein